MTAFSDSHSHGARKKEKEGRRMEQQNDERPSLGRNTVPRSAQDAHSSAPGRTPLLCLKLLLVRTERGRRAVYACQQLARYLTPFFTPYLPLSVPGVTDSCSLLPALQYHTQPSCAPCCSPHLASALPSVPLPSSCPSLCVHYSHSSVPFTFYSALLPGPVCSPLHA